MKSSVKTVRKKFILYSSSQIKSSKFLYLTAKNYNNAYNEAFEYLRNANWPERTKADNSFQRR